MVFKGLNLHNFSAVATIKKQPLPKRGQQGDGVFHYQDQTHHKNGDKGIIRVIPQHSKTPNNCREASTIEAVKRAETI